MRISYTDIDTSEQSLAKTKQAVEHLDNAVRQVSASFDLVFNSDRASEDDQRSLAHMHSDLIAIHQRLEAKLAAAMPVVESVVAS